MARKKVRNITVNEKSYKWVVDNEIRIYTPERKMYRARYYDVFTTSFREGQYPNLGCHYGITPRMIRKYILKNIDN